MVDEQKEEHTQPADLAFDNVLKDKEDVKASKAGQKTQETQDTKKTSSDTSSDRGVSPSRRTAKRTAKTIEGEKKEEQRTGRQKASQAEEAQGEGDKRDKRSSRRGSARRHSKEESDLIERVISNNRVSKVVKGGRRFSVSTLVVVGNGQGKVGIGTGKARETGEATRKAFTEARAHMIDVQLTGDKTIHHDMKGHFGAGKVVLRRAKRGTGIIAGGPMRAIFEALGVEDIVAKSIGSSNPHNMVRATLDALQKTSSPRQVGDRRNILFETPRTSSRATKRTKTKTK
ncbi:MAG: 30S ribosomal protein S5 [Alphaproteobacteria bacterium GM7ARS4]|nr:30S ribosomal protein S5 [Alphaproteobacteria bacterium GM7ARS4]